MTWVTQQVMEAIKTVRCPLGCVKHAHIVKHTSLTGRQVANACAKLEKHRYLTRELYSDDTVKPGCYKLTALGLVALAEGAKLTSGPMAPHGKPKIAENSQRERAWRALRIRRKASVPELIGLLFDADCDQDAKGRATNNLQKYLRLLCRAGYVTEMRREAPESLNSNGAKRYFLMRDTGPLPPVPRLALKKMLDQNQNTHYDFAN